VLVGDLSRPVIKSQAQEKGRFIVGQQGTGEGKNGFRVGRFALNFPPTTDRLIHSESSSSGAGLSRELAQKPQQQKNSVLPELPKTPTAASRLTAEDSRVGVKDSRREGRNTSKRSKRSDFEAS